MRPFKSIVERKSHSTPESEPSNKLFTPANAFTASRPVIAGIGAKMLLEGQRGASIPIGIALATDGVDGFIARWFDNHLPDLHIGKSKIGATGDKYLDLATGLMLCGAIIKAPRMPRTSRAAAGLVLAQEGSKLGWALQRGYQYHQVSGELLEIPTNAIGTEGMIEKSTALFAAVLSSEFDDPRMRLTTGAAALALASLGSAHGEWAREDYEMTYQQMYQHARDQAAVDHGQVVYDLFATNPQQTEA